MLSADGQYSYNITAGSGGWYANSSSNASEIPTLKNMTITGMAVTKDHTLLDQEMMELKFLMVM